MTGNPEVIFCCALRALAFGKLNRRLGQREQVSRGKSNSENKPALAILFRVVRRPVYAAFR